jgi:FixJ family two-component response regulator
MYGLMGMRPALFSDPEAGAGSSTPARAVIGIVDDDASVLRALTRLLGGAGFAVKTFGSASEFLGLEHPETIDCLVLDIHMPGLSGFDLQERLVEARIPIPIIFITAHDDALTRERARKGGGAYLPKPFDAHSLIGAIEKALGSRDSPR